MTTTRRARAGVFVVVCTLATTLVLGVSGPAQGVNEVTGAAVVMTVSPSVDLVDLQTVSVAATGLEPDTATASRSARPE